VSINGNNIFKEDIENIDDFLKYDKIEKSFFYVKYKEELIGICKFLINKDNEDKLILKMDKILL